jgi:hypothetical protein
VADSAPSAGAAPERNANGLPQRRRRRPDADGADRFGPRRPDPSPAEDTGAPVPGLWMADLQSGLSGEGPKTSAARNSRDKTSDEGE